MEKEPDLRILNAVKDGINEAMGAKTAAISVDNQKHLSRYLELLQRWNRVHNLTGISDPLQMVSTHIIDSLSLLPFIEATGKRILDVGTGAGLPGIPLAICCKDQNFVLLDSKQKKINFIDYVILSLQLKNVETVCKRAEQYHPHERFDWVITRAFSSVLQFVATCGHLCQPEGRLVVMQGRRTVKLGERLTPDFTVEKIEPVSVSGFKERCLVFVKRSPQD